MKKRHFQIKHRISDKILFEGKYASFKETVESATLQRADLSCSNMSYADLFRANLSYTNLFDADLSCSNMSGSNLSDANLSCARLSGADLSYANLSYANLSYANLFGANLSGADLSGANLWGEKISKSPLHLNSGLLWQTWITDRRIKIGCQLHTTEFWENASDDTISRMHSNAMKFWRKWKEPILVLAKAHQKDIPPKTNDGE